MEEGCQLDQGEVEKTKVSIIASESRPKTDQLFLPHSLWNKQLNRITGEDPADEDYIP